MYVKGELKQAQYELFTTAARPAAGIIGRKIFDIDLKIVLVDDGTEWKFLDPASLNTFNTAISFIGETKMFHSFNNTIDYPRGWMPLIAGSEVTETKYDLAHTSGAWIADNVASSPLVGLYLPDMTGKYPVGATSTSEDGTSQISSVGNTNNQLAVTHTHPVPAHGHQWYNSNAGATDDTTFNSSGSSTAIKRTISQPHSTSKICVRVDTSTVAYDDYSYEVDTITDAYTSQPSLNTSVGTDVENIQPESHNFIYIMRVI